MASLINKPGLCTKCNKPAEGRNYMVYECLKHLLCVNCVKTRGGLRDTKCAFCRFKKGQKGGGHTLVGRNCSMDDCFKDLTKCNFLCFECGIHQLCIPCAKQTESLDDEDCPLCFVQDGDNIDENKNSSFACTPEYEGQNSSMVEAITNLNEGILSTPLKHFSKSDTPSTAWQNRSIKAAGDADSSPVSLYKNTSEKETKDRISIYKKWTHSEAGGDIETHKEDIIDAKTLNIITNLRDLPSVGVSDLTATNNATKSNPMSNNEDILPQPINNTLTNKDVTVTDEDGGTISFDARMSDNGRGSDEDDKSDDDNRVDNSNQNETESDILPQPINNTLTNKAITLTGEDSGTISYDARLSENGRGSDEDDKSYDDNRVDNSDQHESDSDLSEPDMSHPVQQNVRTPLLLSKVPSSLTHDSTFSMDNEYWSLWRCQQPDTVILGGEDAPILTVLNVRTGKSYTHRIGNADQNTCVLSGLAIDTENHLIMLGNKDRWGQEAIYSLHLDQVITTSQTLYTNNQLSLGGSPRSIFHIKTFQFGVYCIDNHVRIEMFGLKDIVAKTNPEPVKTIFLKKHTPRDDDKDTSLDADKDTPLDADNHTPLDADKPTPRDAGKPTPRDADNHTPLDADNHTPPDADKPTPRDAGKPTPRDADSLYVDEDDNILVSAFHDGCVYVYSREGVCVCTIGSKRKLGETSEAGMLYLPMSLQIYNNNCVVVTCRDGDVHVYYPEKSEYTSGTWKLIHGEDKKVHRAIQTMGYHIVRDSYFFKNIQVYRIGN